MQPPFRFAATALLLLVSVLHAPAASLAFLSDSDGFAFDTGVLRGKLRAGSKSKGLSSVLHVPTGTALDRSMGLMGHYRVFSANKRYGTAAWDWPSEATLTADGKVEVRWPATADRPFVLRSTYRWVQPDTLEVETSVTAHTNLAGFESFLASYFAPSFSNSIVWIKELPTTKQPGFMPVEKNNGTWQVFPRDDAAMQLVNDGRWTIPPNPVDWVRMPEFAAPVIVRRSPETKIAVVIMAKSQDCFAVLSPEQAEGHFSAYLSLFGTNLTPGQTARARARLWVTSNFSEPAVKTAYKDFSRSE